MEKLFFRRKAIVFSHGLLQNPKCIGHGDIAVFVGVAVKKKCNAYQFSIAADGYLDLLGFVTGF